MRTLVSFLFMLLLFGCADSEPKLKKLNGSFITTSDLTTKIQKLIDTADVTGLSIAIFNKNKVAYQKSFGYANFDTKDSLTNNTVFYAASFSKAVFGYIVGQLVHEGKIDLDKPLQEYLDKPLPEYEFEKEWKGYRNLQDDMRYEAITARMCMSHTTGFPNWRWMTRENDFFPEGKIRFLIEPGSRYYYSGEGINLLHFVIEKITNKTLEELAQERVFMPLQMNTTSYVWQERFEGKFCNGHNTAGKVIPKDREDEANAAGSLETTLADYSRFMEHLLGEADENSALVDILLESNIRITSKAQFGFRAWEDTNDNDSIELSYGLGWGLLTSTYGRAAFKEGHGDGFQHYSILFPERDTGIIILSNSDNAESIFKELLEITIGDTFTPWQWERYIPYNFKD